MASSWIVLHEGQTTIDKCVRCWEIMEIAQRRGLVRKYILPVGAIGSKLANRHTFVVLGVSSSEAHLRAACGGMRTEKPYTLVIDTFEFPMPLVRWHRGWQRPDIQRVLRLMALANESPEKVWRDWQQAIMMTTLSGPEGNEKWQQT